ncbi:hypothetical protein COB57_04095 [Candidatus Peregrinibacteria bacterium]|nr:MAG: hypothetical protein COB57_04095 [Candidatus Peregrinibacteria bacterium]
MKKSQKISKNTSSVFFQIAKVITAFSLMLACVFTTMIILFFITMAILNELPSFSSSFLYSVYVLMILYYIIVFITLFYFLENAFLKYNLRVLYYGNLFLYLPVLINAKAAVFQYYIVYVLITAAIFAFINKKSALQKNIKEYKKFLITPCIIYGVTSIIFLYISTLHFFCMC